MLRKIIKALLNTQIANKLIDKYLKEQSAIEIANHFFD